MATSSIYSAELAKTRSFYSGHNEVIRTSVATYIIQSTPQNLIDTIRAVAFHEAHEQVAADNEPSAVIVDGRESTISGIQTATKRVRMLFADIRTMIQAVKEAVDLLMQVTRLQSPPQNWIVARQNYHIWVNNTAIGNAANSISRLSNKNVGPRDVIRIVGPLVRYGRKIYWNPVGGSKSPKLRGKQTARGTRIEYANKYQPRWKPYSQTYLRKLVRNAYGNKSEQADVLGRLNKMTPKPGRTEGTKQIVKRIMRANPAFKQLKITDAWVKYGPAGSWGKHSRDDRVPTLSIRLARGRRGKF
jgi:hypothetical protein